MTKENVSFSIGDLKLKNPFILAPLAGVTDKAMRSLCLEQGASLVFAEMVSAKGLWYGDRKSYKLLEEDTNSRETAFQIFGSDPEAIEFAVKDLAERSNPIIDLNAGCPVPKVVKNGEGSALLKNIDKLHESVSIMVANAGKPVTVKMRMGFEKDSNVAVEAAKAVEAAGASAVTIHGRTRQQYYEGKADWNVIAAVKNELKIPVVGNGDVFSGKDAVRMIHQTGCDGVMIARGALGNPWIFAEALAVLRGESVPDEPTVEQRRDMLLKHIDLVIRDKGEYIAVREMRKHVGWYVKGIRGAAAIKREVNGATDVEQLKKIIRENMQM